MSKGVVLFAARCGDAEAGAGGTIAKLAAAGYRALVVVMTTSVAEPVLNRVQDTLPPVEVCAHREREARDAAALLGHRVEFLRLNERFYWHDGTRFHMEYSESGPAVPLPGRGWLGNEHYPAIRESVKDILRREEPELILTHSPAETLHERWAVQRAVIPAYSALIAEGAAVGKLLAWPPLPGQESQAAGIHETTSIAGYQDRKYAAIRCHASSIPESMIRRLMARDELRGGVKWDGEDPDYAEAFVSLWSGAPLDRE
jgi:LmbE family N-acetylglucosaminyl deacetylase